MDKRELEEGNGTIYPDSSKHSGLCSNIWNYSLPPFPPLPTFGFCAWELFLTAVRGGDWRGGEEGEVRWKGQDDGGLD